MKGTILPLAGIAAFAERMRKEGKTVVTTNGAFDLLHDGHRYLFEECRKLGDILIVGVNSDANVKARKGPDRPRDPQDVRAQNVAQYADAVFIFDDPDPRPWLPLIKPNVHANAETYGKNCVEVPILQEIGARLALIPVKPEFGSTTAIIQNQQRT